MYDTVPLPLPGQAASLAPSPYERAKEAIRELNDITTAILASQLALGTITAVRALEILCEYVAENPWPESAQVEATE